MRALPLLAAFASLAILAPLGACSSTGTDGPFQQSGATSGSGDGGSGGEGGAGGEGGTSAPASSTAASTSGSGGAGGAGGAGGEGGAGGAGSPCPPDADGDGLSDDVEDAADAVDTDGDGTPDFQDLDSDGDSIPDAIEGQTAFVGCFSPQNSDGTDAPDFRDTDSDNNGLPDSAEVYPDGSPYDPAHAGPNPADTDGDNIPDYADFDNDGDTLPDTIELAGAEPVDTDGDGLPDHDDFDSDDDTLADAFEGLSDPDGDGLPAFRDDDADGDGLPDACEAGPGHVVTDPPKDTDSDGKYDALDLDADGDGLLDADEDADLSCSVDEGETNPYLADSDDDGANDLIETVLGSDPVDPLETPGKLGKYWFVLPYLGDPQPATNVVPLRTNLNQGDVAFLVDTTATMGGEIQNLKQGIATIVQELHESIPDLAVGIAGFDDFPTGIYGAANLDLPFYVAGPTGYVSQALEDNLTAVQALNVHDGGDFPESQIAAMYRALTDTFLIWTDGQLPPSGAPGDTYGSLRFRKTALPILVTITDAPFHNGRRANAPLSLHDTYTFNGQQPFPTPTIDELVPAMKAVGAHFVGISASDGVRAGGDPYEDMAYLADAVGSYVPPSAFGGTQCLTGLLGAAVLPDGPATPEAVGGTCRLIFDVSKTGVGVSTSIVTGIEALLQSLKLDLRAIAVAGDGMMDEVDTFIESVAVNASGGNDEAEPGVPCYSLNAVEQLNDLWSGPKGLSKTKDGINETAMGIVPGQKVCFKVVPKPNETIPQTEGAQVFKATLIVKAKNGASPTELTLGKPREIAFIIPPAPQ